MLEVMQFIFSSFWVWLGTLLMLACVASIFADLIRLVFHRKGGK